MRTGVVDNILECRNRCAWQRTHGRSVLRELVHAFLLHQARSRRERCLAVAAELRGACPASAMRLTMQARGTAPFIRPARPGDAPAIAEIYNEGIAGRTATFETRPRNAADIAEWFTRPTHPVLVAQHGEHIVGWIAASPYRPRECYAGIAEVSAYVRASARGPGVGDALLRAFLEACERAGCWKVLSRVFPENAASRALCRRHGFREVGVYEKHARLDGEWRDVIIVERLLGDALPARRT